MHRTILLLILLAGLGVPRAWFPWVQTRGGNGLFSSDSVLHLTLETDLEALLSDRSQESQERPAILRIQGGDKDGVEVPLEVGTRGRFRLQKNICPFPPIRFDLEESRPLGTVFDGQDKIKLVTHCHDRDSFEQNILEEYLAYRIYDRLTEVSFRVRLAEITYVDTRGKNPQLTRMAFLIEDADALARRVGGMLLEIPGARATAFEPQQIGLMFLFQYMIGNIDWSTANSQNLEVIRVGTDHFAVPYDFDWSGLVDAPYAGPSPLTERLHDSVRERLYLGVCWDQIDWKRVFASFEEAKDSIFAEIRSVPGLAEYNVRAATEYIEEFYEFLSNPERAERDISRMCRDE